ncbi:MAG: hypothetical protein HY820_37340 [Acidobacteria bacterium]|nr:hypothetical protein [Acidobacteriota bacterium]
MLDTVIAIDLGTSSCKGAAYTPEGRRIATESRSYPVSTPSLGFAEQDPAQYLRAALDVVAEVGRQANHRPVAIAFSTQTPTLVLLDEALRPLGPAIIWQDSRAVDEAVDLSMIDAATRRCWFGLDLPIGAATTPAKLLWLRNHRPEIWERTRWVVQPKDYVAAAITGTLATDAWCAKGIAHLETGVMHDEWREFLGKTHSICPPVVSTRAVTGHSQGMPVVNGWSDAVCAILATGAMSGERHGFVMTGTSEIIGLSRRAPQAAAGLFHVPPHILESDTLSLHYGPTQAGGSCLDWIAGVLGRTATEALALVAQRDGLSEILCRPYWQGERAPYWDHTLRASFEGLRGSHTAADLVHAVLQGVALQERLVLDTAEQDEPAHTVVLAGGAARDARWNQLRADVLQRNLVVMEDGEASLRGAAMLAWQALGENPKDWTRGRLLHPRAQYRDQAAALFRRFAAARAT